MNLCFDLSFFVFAVSAVETGRLRGNEAALGEPLRLRKVGAGPASDQSTGFAGAFLCNPRHIKQREMLFHARVEQNKFVPGLME